MPRSLSQSLLRALGVIAVLAILGFLILPAFVVTLAAFNSKAILSFPPESWSWRWFAKAVAYEDFQAGFRNGLIVTTWASSIALVAGTGFAIALDRYDFRFERMIETVLLAPLVVPHFTIGLGFLILAANLGLARGYAVVIVSTSCSCCRSCCAASTSRCAISIRGWSLPPRALGRRLAAFSRP